MTQNDDNLLTKCSEVTYDMCDSDKHEPHYLANVGDLLWNPKSGDGHVLVSETICGQKYNGRTVNCGCQGYGIQPCPNTTLVCECGEDDSWRDHHYELIKCARRVGTWAPPSQEDQS